ncbi:hypothetical protein ACIU1J_10075 [Azospirillum doebereinerae]|uniref:hypothetical protein n=1 Tax=Azospirillum doebereinerae TaxID=92933 RepID=UPI00384CE63C
MADQGRKVSTLERRLAAISQAHLHAGYTSPSRDAHVRTVLKGIRRTHGTASTVKAPIMVEDLRAMVAALPNHPRGLRDRALLLLGFAGAFRRSELVGIARADIAFDRDGVIVTLHRSKTDQEGARPSRRDSLRFLAPDLPGAGASGLVHRCQDR